MEKKHPHLNHGKQSNQKMKKEHNNYQGNKGVYDLLTKKGFLQYNEYCVM